MWPSTRSNIWHVWPLLNSLLMTRSIRACDSRHFVRSRILVEKIASGIHVDIIRVVEVGGIGVLIVDVRHRAFRLVELRRDALHEREGGSVAVSRLSVYSLFGKFGTKLLVL